MKRMANNTKIFSINSKKCNNEKNYCIVCGKYKKKLKKILVLSIVCSKCDSKDENIFKEQESIVILKVFGLINNIEKYQKDKQD